MDEWDRFWKPLNKPWYAKGPWNIILLLLFFAFIDWIADVLTIGLGL